MLSKLLWCSQFVCFGLVEARWEKDAKVLQTKDLDEEKLVTEARAWCVWDSANTGGAVGQNLELTLVNFGEGLPQIVQVAPTTAVFFEL